MIRLNDKMYCTGIPIRLVNGSSYNEGRVEVYYNNEWGTVCDDGWDDTDAGVVCRQLGFGSSGTAIGSAGFGQGSGSVWLSNVMCTGSESLLPRCGHLGVDVSSCTHSEDAGVMCNITGAENSKIMCIMQLANYVWSGCIVLLRRKFTVKCKYVCSEYVYAY